MQEHRSVFLHGLEGKESCRSRMWGPRSEGGSRGLPSLKRLRKSQSVLPGSGLRQAIFSGAFVL